MTDAASWPARAGGLALAGVVAALAAARRGRPLHPQGVVRTAHLVLDPAGPAAELAYDGPALVRVSRGAGLPRGWPDLPGLAVRWERDGVVQDVLLSGTGLGRWTRFVLAPRRRPWPGAFGTLMPFRTARGPVMVGALAREEDGQHNGRVPVRLAMAAPLGPWRSCGRIVLGGAAAPQDQDVRFDPVLHCPQPWSTYDWAAALRLPAYRTARRRQPEPAPT